MASQSILCYPYEPLNDPVRIDACSGSIQAHSLTFLNRYDRVAILLTSPLAYIPYFLAKLKRLELLSESDHVDVVPALLTGADVAFVADVAASGVIATSIIPSTGTTIACAVAFVTPAAAAKWLAADAAAAHPVLASAASLRLHPGVSFIPPLPVDDHPPPIHAAAVPSATRHMAEYGVPTRLPVVIIPLRSHPLPFTQDPVSGTLTLALPSTPATHAPPPLPPSAVVAVGRPPASAPAALHTAVAAVVDCLGGAGHAVPATVPDDVARAVAAAATACRGSRLARWMSASDAHAQGTHGDATAGGAQHTGTEDGADDATDPEAVAATWLYAVSRDRPLRVAVARALRAVATPALWGGGVGGSAATAAGWASLQCHALAVPLPSPAAAWLARHAVAAALHGTPAGGGDELTGDAAEVAQSRGGRRKMPAAGAHAPPAVSVGAAGPHTTPDAAANAAPLRYPRARAGVALVRRALATAATMMILRRRAHGAAGAGGWGLDSLNGSVGGVSPAGTPARPMRGAEPRGAAGATGAVALLGELLSAETPTAPRDGLAAAAPRAAVARRVLGGARGGEPAAGASSSGDSSDSEFHANPVHEGIAIAISLPPRRAPGAPDGPAVTVLPKSFAAGRAAAGGDDDAPSAALAVAAAAAAAGDDDGDVTATVRAAAAGGVSFVLPAGGPRGRRAPRVPAGGANMRTDDDSDGAAASDASGSESQSSENDAPAAAAADSSGMRGGAADKRAAHGGLAGSMPRTPWGGPLPPTAARLGALSLSGSATAGPLARWGVLSATGSVLGSAHGAVSGGIGVTLSLRQVEESATLLAESSDAVAAVLGARPTPQEDGGDAPAPGDAAAHHPTAYEALWAAADASLGQASSSDEFAAMAVACRHVRQLLTLATEAVAARLAAGAEGLTALAAAGATPAPRGGDPATPLRARAAGATPSRAVGRTPSRTPLLGRAHPAANSDSLTASGPPRTPPRSPHVTLSGSSTAAMPPQAPMSPAPGAAAGIAAALRSAATVWLADRRAVRVAVALVGHAAAPCALLGHPSVTRTMDLWLAERPLPRQPAARDGAAAGATPPTGALSQSAAPPGGVTHMSMLPSPPRTPQRGATTTHHPLPSPPRSTGGLPSTPLRRDVDSEPQPRTPLPSAARRLSAAPLSPPPRVDRDASAARASVPPQRSRRSGLGGLAAVLACDVGDLMARAARAVDAAGGSGSVSVSNSTAAGAAPAATSALVAKAAAAAAAAPFALRGAAAMLPPPLLRAARVGSARAAAAAAVSADRLMAIHDTLDVARAAVDVLRMAPAAPAQLQAAHAAAVQEASAAGGTATTSVADWVAAGPGGVAPTARGASAALGVALRGTTTAPACAWIRVVASQVARRPSHAEMYRALRLLAWICPQYVAFGTPSGDAGGSAAGASAPIAAQSLTGDKGDTLMLSTDTPLPEALTLLCDGAHADLSHVLRFDLALHPAPMAVMATIDNAVSRVAVLRRVDDVVDMLDTAAGVVADALRTVLDERIAAITAAV